LDVKQIEDLKETYIGQIFSDHQFLTNLAAVINAVAILAWIALTFLIILEYKKIKAKATT